MFQNRNELYTDRVFAGLVTVVLSGMLFEHLVFDAIERFATRRRGVQRRPLSVRATAAFG